MIGVILLAVFAALAFLMYQGKLPALLALPLLALSVSFIAALPFYYEQAAFETSFWARGFEALASSLNLTFVVVVSEGVPRLQTAIFTVMLGGIFSQFLKLSGVAEGLVRKVAELAGDNPFILSLTLTLVVAFLFTTLSGLGSLIMVANIYFPVLMSLGVPPLLAGCLLLIGFCLGGLFNLVNWALYLDVLKLSSGDVSRFMIPFGLLNFLALLAFLVIEFRRARLAIPTAAFLKAGGALLAVAAPLVWMGFPAPLSASSPAPRLFFLAVMTALLCLPSGTRWSRWPIFVAPFIPIALVLFLRWSINPAFMMGILYLLKTSATADPRRPRRRILVQSVLEGIQQVIPAVAIMIGIGMVLIAFSQPPIASALNPLLSRALPKSAWGFVVFFTALAPLALYRGPFNLWGMGSGLLAMLQKTGILNGPSLLAAFVSTGQIQGVCDPTNTHNVWIANQLKIDVNLLLKKTLPYMWALAFFGLLLGAYAR